MCTADMMGPSLLTNLNMALVPPTITILYASHLWGSSITMVTPRSLNAEVRPHGWDASGHGSTFGMTLNNIKNIKNSLDHHRDLLTLVKDIRKEPRKSNFPDSSTESSDSGKPNILEQEIINNCKDWVTS